VPTIEPLAVRDGVQDPVVGASYSVQNDVDVVEEPGTPLPKVQSGAYVEYHLPPIGVACPGMLERHSRAPYAQQWTTLISAPVRMPCASRVSEITSRMPSGGFAHVHKPVAPVGHPLKSRLLPTGARRQARVHRVLGHTMAKQSLDGGSDVRRAHRSAFVGQHPDDGVDHPPWTAIALRWFLSARGGASLARSRLSCLTT
jgi:hypothetical protein